MPVSALQFWLGLRFKNFIVPIGIGLGLWMASTVMVFEARWESVTLFPYAYPAPGMIPRYQSRIPYLQLGALVYTAFFLLLAFADLNGRKGKG